VVAADLWGGSFVFASHTGVVEVLGTRIFAGTNSIDEYDHQGNMVATIPRPPEIPRSITFVALPDGGFAFLENSTDSMYFMDAAGNFITADSLPERSPHNRQNLSGTIVANSLIISETGTRKLVEVDLATYGASIFRELSDLGGHLSDIDYSNGVFYICRGEKVHYFTASGDAAELCHLPVGNNTGIAVIGTYAYVVKNSPGELYKVDISTGQYELLLGGLNYAQDLEHLPVALEP
jgi:hypothetical protein